MMEFKRYLKSSAQLFTFSVLLIFLAACSGKPKSESLILIGIDGMGVSGLQEAHTPNLDKIIQSGALSMKTRGVMPTVSGPNWSSHLLGAGPEQHGITANDWTVDNHSVVATEKDADGYFPSVFALLHEQRPEAKTAMFYDWDALINYYNPKTISKVEFSKDFHETFEKATPWIIDNDPLFSFIYVGHPDEVGHEFGWGTKEYLKALEEVDAAIGKFFDQLKESGKYENTHFIVVTDHGGNENGHGGLSMEEIEIPWMISGPGVIQDRLIEQPSSVVNTASTIASLLDLHQPESWTGKAVLGAFEFSAESKKNINSYVPQAISSLKSGIYFRSETTTLTSPWPKCQIRFTQNGQDPTIDDPVYKSPILLDRSQVLKFASFQENKRSRITTLNFTKSVLVDKINIDVLPEEKYSGQGSQSLINQKTATTDYQNQEWLGYQGVSPVVDMIFTDLKSIRSVKVGYLNKTYSWIFPPLEIRLEATADNKKYVPIKTLTTEVITEKSKIGRNWASLYFDPIKARAIRVYVKAQEQCPPGHAGEGEACWLFLDEIIVE